MNKKARIQNYIIKLQKEKEERLFTSTIDAVSAVDTLLSCGSFGLAQSMKLIERKIIISKLIETKGSVTNTARRLGVKRTTMAEKMNQHQINPDRYRVKPLRLRGK